MKSLTVNIFQKTSLTVLLSFLCFIFQFSECKGQELGYLAGITKQGINPERFEPLYGFTIGAKVNRILSIETAFYYSQRSIGSTIQADYFSFLAMPKIGYFGKKAGVYYAPGISLNPTLYHSNPENHTYLSTLQALGGQFNILPELVIDLKVGLDIGLTGAYFENGHYQNYSGPVIFLGLKYSKTTK